MAAVPYRSTPVFNETSLPDALRAEHSTKADVWGLVRVLKGQVRLTYLDPPSDMILEPGTPGLLAPAQPHFVTPLGEMEMLVEFYREKPDAEFSKVSPGS